jgi:sulfatase maturation enzyme AslB (radical SAM superfamily)
MKDTTKNIPLENSQGMNPLMDALIKAGPTISKRPVMRKIMLSKAEKWVLNNNKNHHQTSTGEPIGVIDDRAAMALAILHSAECALNDEKLSPATFRAASEIIGRDLFVEKKPRLDLAEHFSAQYGGYKQPAFLTLSPSKACNLRCTGCYADADASLPHLEWDLVDKIVTDARTLWGLQFIVVSGGEPMAYRSQGKSILDLAEKHQDVFFMMYTNGTLITDEVAERMAKLGNVVPAISLEGWEARTDARRGKGVYQQVMAAMDRLHKAGVLYGVSLTATRENAEEVLSDEFIDFLFNKKHAVLAGSSSTCPSAAPIHWT